MMEPRAYARRLLLKIPLPLSFFYQACFYLFVWGLYSKRDFDSPGTPNPHFAFYVCIPLVLYGFVYSFVNRFVLYFFLPEALNVRPLPSLLRYTISNAVESTIEAAFITPVIASIALAWGVSVQILPKLTVAVAQAETLSWDQYLATLLSLPVWWLSVMVTGVIFPLLSEIIRTVSMAHVARVFVANTSAKNHTSVPVPLEKSKLRARGRDWKRRVAPKTPASEKTSQMYPDEQNSVGGSTESDSLFDSDSRSIASVESLALGISSKGLVSSTTTFFLTLVARHHGNSKSGDWDDEGRAAMERLLKILNMDTEDPTNSPFLPADLVEITKHAAHVRMWQPWLSSCITAISYQLAPLLLMVLQPGNLSFW
jgi:hypothetical protein